MHREQKNSRDHRLAIVTQQGHNITYGALQRQMERCLSYVDRESRQLALILCDNSYMNLCIYLSCLSAKIPVLLLDVSEQYRVKEIISEFTIFYMWVPQGMMLNIPQRYIAEMEGYVLYELIQNKIESSFIQEEIALLLPTSGSEGKSKFVMLSYKNIISNTEAIIEALHIKETDRAAVMLPLCYSYGLSVIHTHLYQGAVLLMPDLAMVRPKFWDFLSREKVTSLAAVPSDYELMRKLRVFEGKYDLSSLRIITQAGGAMRIDTQRYLLKHCKQCAPNVHIAIMYGQTEATARITTYFVDEHMDKIGSVGKVIPGGDIWIIGEQTEGEVCYKGDNVFLGYVRCQQDLEILKEHNSQLLTGDVGYIDFDGYLYLTGRKSRFAKLNGYRIGLEELQLELSDNIGCEIWCTIERKQDEENLVVCWSDKSVAKEVIQSVLKLECKLRGKWKVQYVPYFPYKQNGKPDYNALIKLFMF